MTAVERVARAICRADSEDPDRPTCDGPAWHAYRGMAEAAIAAIAGATAQAALDSMESAFRAGFIAGKVNGWTVSDTAAWTEWLSVHAAPPADGCSA